MRKDMVAKQVAAAAGEQAVQAVVRLLISRLEQEDQDRKEGEVDDVYAVVANLVDQVEAAGLEREAVMLQEQAGMLKELEEWRAQQQALLRQQQRSLLEQQHMMNLVARKGSLQVRSKVRFSMEI